MVILQSEKLKQWMDLTGRNQAFLAESSGVSHACISQVMNGSPCSGEIISSLLAITSFEFENLFMVKDNNIGENHPRRNYSKFHKKWAN